MLQHLNQTEKREREKMKIDQRKHGSGEALQMKSFHGKRNPMHKRLNFPGILFESAIYSFEIWYVAWLKSTTEKLKLRACGRECEH